MISINYVREETAVHACSRGEQAVAQVEEEAGGAAEKPHQGEGAPLQHPPIIPPFLK